MNVTFIIILTLIIIVIIIILRVLAHMRIDKRKLKNQTIYEKYSHLIDGLNEFCYQGDGIITELNFHTIQLYKEKSCQILTFKYVCRSSA